MLKNLLLTLALITIFSTQSIHAQINNCLDFDGANDYVSLALNNNLEGRSAFTIEMWANASTYMGGQTFFAQSDDNSTRIQIQEHEENEGGLYVFVCNGSNTYGETTSPVFTAGQWFHLAMVFDGAGSTNADKLKLYVNGVQISLTFTGTIPTTTPTLTADALLGSEDTDIQFFSGKMDEVRIWYNSARTQSEIKQYMNTTLGTRTGLLASYHFDEGTAGGNNAGVITLNDKSGATNHSGTLVNFALNGTTSNWISRVYTTTEDNCLQFDGTNDYVNLAGLGTEIDDVTELTIEMWANVNTWSEDETLFSKYYSSISRTQIQEYTNGNLQITIEQGTTDDGNDSRAYTTSTPVCTGNWFHLAMVYDGAGGTNADKLKLYINGQAVALTYRGTINADLNSTVYPALLGAQGAGLSDALCNYFNGRMDEVRIWNAARTQSEIQDNMFATLAGTEAGLVAYYNFNQGTAGGSNSSVLVLNDLSVESDWLLTTSAKNFGALINFALSGSTSNWISSFTPAGEGTNGDPYLIANLDNLNWLSLNSSKWGSYYKQTADIDASGTSTWNSSTGWKPIGNNTTNFTGTYDGDGHTISGLFINRSSTNYLGFFGKTNTGTVIQNLGLADINITGTLDYIGGLVSYASNSSISKCYSTGSVTGSTSSIGGLFGLLFQSDVANCYSTASVTGTHSTGGFVGAIGGGSLSYCYSTGLVTAGGSNVGGFAGSSNINITASFWDTQTSGKATSAGGAGIVGRTTAEMKTITNFTAPGWDFKEESINGTDEIWNTGNDRNNGYPYFNWQFIGDNLPAPSGGGETSGDPYLIATLDHIYWISIVASRWSKYYKQTADIDASSTSTWESGAGWSPIGNETTKFTGTYDGDGHTISGLYINRSATSYIGFFGYTGVAVISDLGAINLNVTGRDFTGGLVGNTWNTTVSNCYSSGNVIGHQYIGGLIGLNSLSSTVRYCYSTCNASGAATCGGLVGYNASSTISNCYSTGAVSASDLTDSGGLVGWNNGAVIQYSYSTGSVSVPGDPKTKGFVGSVSGGTFTSNFWDTETSAETSTGGAYATGKTTAQMKNVATFTDYTDGSDGLSLPVWDFEANPNDDAASNNYWDIDLIGAINNGYPFLSWQNGGETALPVELTSLTASVSNGNIILHWQTETEVNNYGFEIERSEFPNGVKNLQIQNWHKIGFVEGYGNSNSIKEYSFTDNETSSGKYAYRLKQIDIDGSFSYSDVVEVTCELQPSTFELFQNYPNPFNPSTVISFQLPTECNVQLKIYDVLGNEVVTLVNENKPAGNYEVKFDGSNLSSGIYFYQLNAGSFSATKKLILLK